jgi:hypothetical protein
VQEILQDLEHERTEPSTTPIGTLEETTFKHHYKKILCQVLGIGDGMAPPADESENRSPINFAKLGERFARLLLVASPIRAGKNHAPPRRHEGIGAALEGRRGVRVQARASSYFAQLLSKPKYLINSSIASAVIALPSFSGNCRGSSRKRFGS